MNKKALVIGLLLLAAVGVAVAASRQQATEEGAPDDLAGFDEAGSEPPSWDAGASDWIDYWTTQNYTETESNTMPLANPQTNVSALLQTIKWAEGTAAAADPFAVCFGYKHTIANFADHPAVTGEWKGEPLSAALCAGAGLGPGCVSTAAGAFQIIKPTWLRLKSRLSLTDFSAASQEAAAVELLRECGALALVQDGKFTQAISAARRIWASLPGAGYKQGERSIAALTTQFTSAGGVLA